MCWVYSMNKVPVPIANSFKLRMFNNSYVRYYFLFWQHQQPKGVKSQHRLDDVLSHHRVLSLALHIIISLNFILSLWQPGKPN